jgi:aminoglycoside/choline kinase family phosphotransferase
MSRKVDASGEAAEERRLELVAKALGLSSAVHRLTPLAGDIGGRRYFRLAEGRRRATLLVLYPESRSTAQENWRAVRSGLKAVGLRVPELFVDAPEAGAALIEDLGDVDFGTELRRASSSEKLSLLEEAELLLHPLRSIDPAIARRNPPFDAAFFAKELSHTRLWALEKGGASPLSPADADEWEILVALLAREAADASFDGPPVPVHRDFHANNLIRTADGPLAMIDFQDLRLGPRDYDGVSLRFERAGAEAPLPPPGRYRTAVLLQRAWKVLGTFEKMLRWGRPIYTPHRDTARRVIREHTDQTNPYFPLLRFLDL